MLVSAAGGNRRPNTEPYLVFAYSVVCFLITDEFGEILVDLPRTGMMKRGAVQQKGCNKSTGLSSH